MTGRDLLLSVDLSGSMEEQDFQLNGQWVDRLTALKFYTLGSAWFSFDDDVRGSLEVGKLADLAVLSADYLTVPLDAVGNIESVLTLLGGEVVYASGELAGLEN